MDVLQHILVATDLSSRADAAIARALQLAGQHRAKLVALHVASPLSADESFLGVRLDLAEMERQAETVLRERLRSADVEGDIAVKFGEAFVEIIRFSREHGSDIVVLGAHGARYIKDLLLGTTAERVVRKGRRPVLVVKQAPQGPYRRVLAPVDFSDASRQSLVFARTIAPDADLRVLHAFELRHEYRLLDGGMTRDQLLTYERESAIRLRKRLKAFVGDSGIDPGQVKLSVRTGYPATVITGVARRSRADLVAIGTHGMSGLRYLLLGSVAEHALREAPCDVLAVHPAAFQFELP